MDRYEGVGMSEEGSTIGGRIKDFREAIGMTQSELAGVAELTPAAISQIEANLREPQASSLARISISMGVSSDFILGINADMKVSPRAEAIIIVRNILEKLKDSP